MKLQINDVLIAKTSFQNTNTIDNFFIKDKKYTVRIVHSKKREYDDSHDYFRSIDYIIVNDLPGFSFYIEDMYKDKYNYIWNCFYMPSEIRKMKLKKINQNA